MAKIHPTAIVEPGAQLADDVIIGPYCTVSAEAVIGRGTELISHVVIAGNTTLGEENRVSPFAVLGGRTQDLKFKGGSPGVKIGNKNTIREYVTVNAATNDGDYTVVGDQCLLMAYSHVAHCCRVGSQVIIANGVQIAGHVTIEDQATIEGMVGIVQFLRVGRMAFIGGLSKVSKDVPPFMIAHGDPIEVRGFNRVGMERRGCSDAARKAIKEAYRILYRAEEPLQEAITRLEKELEPIDELNELIAFCRSAEKGIVR
ncbi:MAG: acyl-[acyl-carrier-protein]--UDP-N-acetylglucosamine O-acyltransferase [Kiritimatiellaceae bacterium]|jgi:UDP-N-acetylglucosamine acyltransferase|nr:acyl-[acyl-carrier-protein]--UDP-N-acetylglucosamine O-acyltransferase [Kiritimatiellaceae bacterium]|tara:strand:+ start:2818 stop:3591 length:774 start_codon:yes stop_codon:yes gene_type:complete